MRRRWLIAWLAALGLVAAHAASPPEVFSDKSADPAALDRAWKDVPPPVRPAVEFQKVLLRIRGGAAVGEWKPAIWKFANAAGDDGATAALREAAKVWLARAAMDEIDAALRKHYRREVRFPDSLAEVDRDIPADAKADPWGEPWNYQPAAPRGFSKLVKQRYHLAPKRYPALSPLAAAVKAKPAALAWKLTPREVAGSKVMELRGADGKAAMLQAGGRAGEVSLVFIGDGWALLADTERLFTVSF